MGSDRYKDPEVGTVGLRQKGEHGEGGMWGVKGCREKSSEDAVEENRRVAPRICTVGPCDCDGWGRHRGGLRQAGMVLFVCFGDQAARTHQLDVREQDMEGYG